MPENQLSLYFDLKPGKKADLEIISAAAIAWVEALRATAQAIDPESDIKVELVDADESSLIFNTVVEWLERHVEPKLKRIERGGKRLPRTKKLAFALMLFVIVTGYPTYDFYFGDEPFTDEDRQMLKEIYDQVVNEPAVETAKKKFYRTLEREPAITGVGIKEKPEDRKPIILVPSDRFAEAGGLWTPDVEEDDLEVSRPVLDVVLVKPALVNRQRSWTFKPEGLPDFEAV
ncbi:MAG: hypothetical protein ACT4OE_06515, partial [Sphingosinicella sp.]